MKVYLVGGAVRDELLGLDVDERDWVVVGATPESMRLAGYRPVGRDFPVFINPRNGEEFALARTERKTAPGHQGFEFHADPEITLEQDLARRDLTINAIARAPDGTLVDPYGGRRDLEQRILRHVSPAFVEDPLRVLRVARFAARFHALGFRIAPETLALMRRLAESGELDALTPERVWKEFERSLAGPAPRVFLEVLAAAHALPVLFPLFARLADRQTLGDHPAFASLDVATGSAAPDTLAAERFVALVAAAARDQRRLPEADEPGFDPEAGARAETFCNDLRTPRAERDGAVALAQVFAPLTAPAGLTAADLLRAAERADAARRSERLDLLAAATLRLLTALDADRTRWTRAARVLEGLAEAMRVDVADLQSRGFEGAAMGEQVRLRRLHQVERLLRNEAEA